MADFINLVHGEIWTILSRTYSTVRHGGHPSDAEEFRRDRSFWPDMQFHGAEAVDNADGGQIRITFTPVREPGVTYGYRIDVETAAAAWSKRVGIRDPHASPAMFAAELIWYMVAYIGSTPIEESEADHNGIRWINTGADVFTALPDPLAMQHLEHH